MNFDISQLYQEKFEEKYFNQEFPNAYKIF